MPQIPILKTLADLRLWRNQQESPLHFVPTMGGLHRGHSQLITNGKKLDSINSSKVLVSIFVNPLQFGANEDFNSYPRDLESDYKKSEEAGASAVWAPSIEEIFPGGADTHFQLKVPQQLQQYLCGANRPGHFDGVASVMVQLLKLVRPQVLILGEKDWQQLVILRHLINDLGLPIRIHGVATVRDQDGMAYSSRNCYLSHSERSQAINLPHELQKASQKAQARQIINTTKIQKKLEKSGLKVEYLETVDPELLQPVRADQNLCLLAAAVRCGKTRLIDHTFLMNRKPIVAIDGPAGAGKSTVTKAFAEKMNLTYLDTGAMYRAVTWLIQQKNIDPSKHSKVKETLKDLRLDLKPSSSGVQRIIINSQDVTEIIRSPEVTSFVSTVAAQAPVRETLTNLQKDFGKQGGLVAEGRDIGTAVFPHADLKIFLTASIKERARRRVIDLKEKNFKIPNISELENQIMTRDNLDSTREISPLVKAEDAIELITDGMDIDEVINNLIDMFRVKVPTEVWPYS